MAKRIITSASAERRLLAARTWLADQARGDREILVLAPTRGAADDLLYRACPAGAGLLGVHRLTPLQLASDLATRPLAAQGRVPVTHLGIEALAARSIALCGQAGKLSYFNPVIDAPGLARALAATLRELRAYAVDGRALAATGPPGRDLSHLVATYEEELKRWSLADEALLLGLAGQEIERATHRLVGLPLLVLDGSPLALTERRFLAPLVDLAPDAVATVAAGDDEGRAALEEIFQVAAEELEPAHAGRATSKLERLRRRVFQPEIPADADEAPDADDSSVLFLAAPGEGRETIEIARRIRGLVDEGLEFDSVAILLRDPEAYLPLVEEALRRAEIPACFTRGTARPHPSGRAFLALLACAGENYSASRFAEYLSLGEVPEVDEAGAPPIKEVPWVEPRGDQLVFKSFLPEPTAEDEESDESTAAAADGDELAVVAGTLQTPWKWEELLVDAAVLGGRDRWERRLDGLAAELEMQIRELGDEDVGRRKHMARQRDRLAHLKRFALPVVEILAVLPEAASWGDWLDALEQLASRVLRRPEKVLEVLAELRPMDEVGPVTLDEVHRVLEERLTFLRSDPPERRYGRVLVATIEEARGRGFDTVFLPGLAEGIFPRRASEDPLLLDAYRERLGAALPTQAKRVTRERLLLRIAAGAARSRLVISYPNLDPLRGRARVPSFYALDVLRAAEGRLPDLRQLEARAATESASLLGWPAPRVPQAAIDAAEYDLSVLEPLLRQPPADSKGKGRFLLETNDWLGRSLRSRYRRWRPSFSAADGLVGPDDATREALTRHRLRNRGYSPTALQNYATCPYRFLLQAIHRLRPRDQAAPLEQLDPLTRGSLFHEVQFELLGALRERNLLPMREESLPELFDLADQTLVRIAGRYEEELAPAIPRVWRSEMVGIRIDLRGWIRAVTGAAEAWRPAYFELSFGLPRQPGHDPASRREEAAVLDGIRLRGSIDVVEADDRRGTLRVTDHKTGRALKRRNLQVGGGETLQPLLYALAVEDLLGRPVASGRLFYCTRRGEYQALEVPLDDGSRKQIAQVLELIDRAVAEGFLPAAPRERACTWCDYRLVCGPFEEMRVKRKKKEQLVTLEKLREMP
ncbi:MAG: Dna2/Cas4 domain-containing protein [bacterium]|nr:Dna2/Cas4 domain-containing protein [bacterium]